MGSGSSSPWNSDYAAGPDPTRGNEPDPFFIQGQDPYDPAVRRSVTDVMNAVERPVEHSLQRVAELNQQQAQTLALQQDAPTKDGTKIGPRTM